MGHIRQPSSEHVDRFGHLLWDRIVQHVSGVPGLGMPKRAENAANVELVVGGITDSLRARPPVI